MVVRSLFLVLSFFVVCLAAKTGKDGYAEPEICARCHPAIAAAQSKTAMANTWRGSIAASLPANFDEKKDEGASDPLHYEVRRSGDRLEFSVANAGKEKLTAPVQAVVGGNRHGVSFLLGLDRIGGFPLERPVMLEGRYAFSPLHSLVLSPGFATEKPADGEDELGRVLSPTFEVRCLTCHGKPDTLGAGIQGGVRCESCHGPAAAHVNSVTAGNRGEQLIKPKTLARAEIVEVCAQCHSGLSAPAKADPMPEDLLVSNQVPALRNSECFIQSGKDLTCTDCHNPHADSITVAQSIGVCLRCHSLTVAQHAAICPINQTQDCIGCHMPTVDSNSFHLTDHWIRVHPEPGSKAQPDNASLRSQVVPRREFLRLIVTENDEQAKAATQRLAKGDSFSTVAHDLSVDATAPGGGYVGDMELSEMDPKLASSAAHLPYGGTSEVIKVGSNRMILYRLPRNFRWQADQLFLEASELKDRGNLSGAIAKNQEALQVYPYFLRGLVMMGTMLGSAGDANRASEILRFAVQFYPKDAPSRFDLALTLGKQPADQIEALRRAIELDPDMVAAYQSLGAALYSTGQAAAAIDTFRRGLQIDPLSPILSYDLGLALKEQGDSAGSGRALGLAEKLDPEIAVRK